MKTSCLFAIHIAIATVAAGQTGSTRINGESIHYEVSGKGTPLVLIHGWSLDMRMWDPQVASLGREFRVIRYDRRGFGKSTGAEDFSWDAADLKALLDTLGVSKANILGMSQGGRVAIQFARDHPDQVLSLILQSTVPPEGFPIPWTGADRVPFDEFAKIAATGGIHGIREKWKQHRLMQLPRENHGATMLRDRMIDEYRGSRIISPAKPSGPGTPDRMDDLRGIDVPVLIIIGDHDAPYIDLVGRALAYIIPRAELAVIPGGWHLANVTAPQRFNSTLIAFLRNPKRGDAMLERR